MDMPDTPAKTPSKNRKSLAIGIAIIALAAAVIIIALLARSGNKAEQTEFPSATSQSNTAQSESNSPAEAAGPKEVSPQAKAIIDEAQRRDKSDMRAKGSLDAPVVVSIFADFRCGHCIDFALNVEPQIQKLIDDGTIRYEFNNFPILGDESRLAAQAAQAAAAQQKFWEYHDALFQGAKSQSISYDVSGLTDLAQKVGVADLEKFRADMTSPETTDFVNTEVIRGRDRLGLQGVPALLIGYSYVPGGVSYEEFTAILQKEMQRK